MRVEITTSPGIFLDGSLKDIVAEQNAPYPHIVIEVSVTGGGSPAKVTFDEIDLATIMRLARGSKVRRIRDAVTP